MASQRDSSADNAAAMELFKVVCLNGGVMELGKAVASLSSRSKVIVQKHGAARFVEKKFKKIFKVRREQSSVELEAIFPFVFCQDAGKGTCSNGSRCVKLHLCPFSLKGTCMYKGKCRLSHDKRDAHTMELLRAVHLENIDDDVLDVLLKKIVTDTEMERGASTHTIPDICKHYNSQDGCSKKDKCAFLHVCKYYVEDKCKFPNCRRIHDLVNDPHNQEVLKKFRLGRLTTPVVLSLLSGRKRHSSSSSDSSHQGSPQSHNSMPAHPSQKPQSANHVYAANQAATSALTKQDAEICGFHLKGNCNYGDKCMNLHRDMLYQWQFQDIGSTNWKDFPIDSNTMLEQRYCKLDSKFNNCIISQHPYCINFDKMVANSQDVMVPKLSLRRVSTKSSVEAPPGHIFSTQWKWYWKDENNTWQSYDSPEDGVAANTTCSKSLEKDYLQDKGSHVFSAGLHSYILHFDGMFQRNVKYMTERDVIRRPEFVHKDKMKQIALKRKDDLKMHRSASSLQTTDSILPSHWSPMDDREFRLEPLSVTSKEYKDAESKFQNTMTSPKRVDRIQRIQNPDLWIAYAQKKARMESKGKAPQERQLFHGTSPGVRDAICQQGFDWRMCGKHGTMYGQGSYFACQASYSHNYAGPDSSNLRCMFLARVLVGEYAVGSRLFTRPPPKDSSKPHGELYDSCVNDESNPSIFVVFENSQAYPEFMITYI